MKINPFFPKLAMLAIFTTDSKPGHCFNLVYKYLTSCFSIKNVDATVLAQKPKLAPHIPRMRENLARAMGVGPEQVNVKATTEEGLGFTGSGEGMAAHAVCLIEGSH